MQPGGAPSGSSPASSPRPEQPPTPSQQQQQQQAQHLGFARNQVSRPWCSLSVSCPTAAAVQWVRIYFLVVGLSPRVDAIGGETCPLRARPRVRSLGSGRKKSGAFIGAGFSCLAATVARLPPACHCQWSASACRGCVSCPIRPSSSICGVQCGFGLQFHASCVFGPGFFGDGGPCISNLRFLVLCWVRDCCAIQFGIVLGPIWITSVPLGD